MRTTPTVSPAIRSARSSEREYAGPHFKMGSSRHLVAAAPRDCTHCEREPPSAASDSTLCIESLALGSFHSHLGSGNSRPHRSDVGWRGSNCASDASVAHCVGSAVKVWGRGTLASSLLVHDLLRASRTASSSSCSGRKALGAWDI